MTPGEVLGIKSVERLRDLRPDNFPGRAMTQGEISHILGLCGALWIHDGNKDSPHAELTSGKCSNGFVDVLRALSYTNLCEIFAHEIIKAIHGFTSFNLSPVTWVIGSDHAGAALSHIVATVLGCRHDFTEKGPDKTQVWKRFPIKPDEVVLQVEELATTLGTLKAVRDGIKRGNKTIPTFTPFSVVLVNRSGLHEFEGAPIFDLVSYDIKVWEPDQCPLCKAGSRHLRPKQNWAELTGKR